MGQLINTYMGNRTKNHSTIMKFNKPTIIALTTTAATPVRAWNMGPAYLSVSALQVSSSSINRMLEQERAIAQRMFDMVDYIVDPRRQQQQRQILRYPLSSHQRYELIDNNEKFELKVDVPGVKEENLDIKLDEGRLTVEGQRVTESKTSQFTSNFSKTFSLDRTVDVDKFTASLNNGVLVISAPKDMAKLEENIRKIPITAVSVVTADKDSAMAETNKKILAHKEQESDEVKLKVPVCTPKAETEDAAETDSLDLDALKAE